MANIHDFVVKDAQGGEQALAQYRDRVVLIVNTASHCGFTPQYKDLQALYDAWHAKGLAILAFPCNQFGQQEPGSNEEIQQFCQNNYGVTFPVFAKIEVNGPQAHPLYEYLRALEGMSGDIKWNFTKFLVDPQGNVVRRYESKVNPQEIGKDIQGLLQSQ